MHALIAVQAAFCFLVLFVAGLFVATFDRLSHQPTGFSAERLLILDTVIDTVARPASRRPFGIRWPNICGAVPGVEKVALAAFAAARGYGNELNAISVNGAPPTDGLDYVHERLARMDRSDEDSLARRPGIPRRLTSIPALPSSTRHSPSNISAVENPLGKWFERTSPVGCVGHRLQIVGLVGDARYSDMRQAHHADGLCSVPFDSTFRVQLEHQ